MLVIILNLIRSKYKADTDSGNMYIVSSTTITKEIKKYSENMKEI